MFKDWCIFSVISVVMIFCDVTRCSVWGVGLRGDINVSEVHLSPSSEWKSLLEGVLAVNENIFRKMQFVMASIGVKF